MSNTEAVATIRQSYTVAIDFVVKPDEATLQRLKAEGYKYSNGHWYKNDTKRNFATQEQVRQILVSAA